MHDHLPTCLGTGRQLMLTGLALLVIGCRPPTAPVQPEQAVPVAPPTPPATEGAQEASGPIHFPKESWQPAGIEIEPAAMAPIEQAASLTGRIMLNEDRLAHVFPLVESRVAEVLVGLGDDVTEGQDLVIVQSREVGQARLQLVQDRLALGFARRKDQWAQGVAENTDLLIKLIRANTEVEEIEEELKDRPLGTHRDRLMTAYIAESAAKRNLERLRPLSTEGIVGTRQIYEADAAWDTARATLQSLLEQLGQDARQEAVLSSQQVEELESRVATDETALEILGFSREDIARVDVRQGEALARCTIEAPFDGTVISKDVVLLEHVGPTNQILSIADLGTVWLATDVYEEHLPLLEQLKDRPLTFQSDAWPGRTFTAQVFYTGDIVTKESRTVAMLALAENAEGLLKPGMFVRVRLPGSVRATVLQVPLSAVLEHEGRSFVFVQVGDEAFQRRDVTLGRQSAGSIEVVEGIAVGDRVVTGGGFTLKSRLLADLLEE